MSPVAAPHKRGSCNRGNHGDHAHRPDWQHQLRFVGFTAGRIAALLGANKALYLVTRGGDETRDICVSHPHLCVCCYCLLTRDILIKKSFKLEKWKNAYVYG